MTAYFIIKCVVSGILVGLISEIARRNPTAGALTASLPITSILALVWLYRDTGKIEDVVALSNNIALVVLPSLTFFIILSLLLKFGWNFYASLGSSCVVMALVYVGYVGALSLFDVKV